MSNIDKQAVQAVADLKAGYTLGHADVAILQRLARIALASLEAGPAIHRWRRVTSEPYGPYPWHYGDFIGFSKPVDGIEDEYFYSAPPAPANAEPVAWLWSHRKHPSEVSLVRPEDDERAEGAHWSGWSCQALYAAPPAPVSVPDEDLLHMAASAIDDLLSNKDRSGAGVWADIPAKLRRAAMLQGAEPASNRDELPLDYLQGHKDGLEWAAQLAEANHPQTGDWLYDDPIDLARAIRKGPDMPTAQAGNHTEQHLDMVDHSGDTNKKVWDVTLINKGNIPATRFQTVADLYGITSPTGSETSFTFDVFEASSFAKGGWSVQEYVKLERYQQAVTGNSPVIPYDVRRMDWLVSKTVDVREPMVYGSHSLFWSQTITDEEDDFHATKLREQIDEAMAAEQAAAPQQEVK